MIGIQFIVRILMIAGSIVGVVVLVIGAYMIVSYGLIACWSVLEFLLPNQAAWIAIRFRRIFPKRKRKKRRPAPVKDQ